MIKSLSFRLPSPRLSPLFASPNLFSLLHPFSLLSSLPLTSSPLPFSLLSSPHLSSPPHPSSLLSSLHLTSPPLPISLFSSLLSSPHLSSPPFSTPRLSSLRLTSPLLPSLPLVSPPFSTLPPLPSLPLPLPLLSPKVTQHIQNHYSMSLAHNQLWCRLHHYEPPQCINLRPYCITGLETKPRDPPRVSHVQFSVDLVV